MPRYSLPTTTLTLFQAWSPADVAADEVVDLPNLHVGVGDFIVGAAVTVAKATATGTTGSIAVGDAVAMSLTSVSVDDWPTTSTLCSRFAVNVPVTGWDSPITLTYTAGATPGAVKPVVHFYLMIVPRVFDALG